LYIGSTSDLVRRVWEHKVKAIPGFTAKYGVDRLVWFEGHDTLEAAMQREKRINS
jgi:putative endonuclease